MGAITASTALLISAGTGVATKGVGALMSFGAANRARNAQEVAERDAEKKMAEARRKLEVNFADALSINKEPYEREREAMLSAGAQALEAGVESERGGAATAGRVLAQQQQGQGAIRDEMNRDLFDLEAQKAEEDSRLRDISVGMDLQEVAGAQQAAASAEARAAAQNTQGINQTIGAVADGISMFNLYGENKTALAEAKSTQAGLDKQAAILAAEKASVSAPKTVSAPGAGGVTVNGTPMSAIAGAVAQGKLIQAQASKNFQTAIDKLDSPMGNYSDRYQRGISGGTPYMDAAFNPFDVTRK